MQFKGRSVFLVVMITMLATVLITLIVTDRLMQSSEPKPAVVAAAASPGKSNYSLSSDELTKLNAVMELIETKYYAKVEREDVFNGAISGMMAALNDPYSVYMEENVARHFSESIEGSFTGIGAEVTLENSRVVVVSPIKGSPAEKSGLLAKDIILSVNGEALDGLSLQEAVSKIRGPKGSKAKLSVQRSGLSEPIQLVLVRDDIDIETVYAELQPDGIGVIEIRQFSMHTGERFAEELTKLESQGMKGLVIDVRNNPGGVLPVVVDIAQHMMKPNDIVVQVEDRDGNREQTRAEGGELKTYPISVLINKGSASASEILAGALQESSGAYVMGEQSFGKGTVQVSYNKALGDGSLLKMTIAKWLTPKGNWIHEKGIQPNKVITPPELYTVARIAYKQPLTKDTISEQNRSAQIMLNGLGFETGRADGYFDDKTEQAVIQFQKKHGLKASGIIDENTTAALEKSVIAWIQDKNNDLQLQAAIDWIQQARAGKK
ncbi:S41 family peptidase [Paenibacillus sp. GXUN7292]|uniref:S41 family peptidase n=1 Tax=Paenibacillus sp. GXUN7292 TaxID=3422499 RepID=UPI003D7CE485